MQTFPDVLSRLLHLQISEPDETCPTCDVIDFFEGEEWTRRLYLNGESHLPECSEQISGQVWFAEQFSGKMSVTTYSDFKTFGPAVLPTGISVSQDDELLFDITIDEADFVMEPDDELFEFPSSQ